MKCLSCEKLSFSIICKSCQKELLSPNLYKRELDNNFFVYSFYNYEEVEELLKSKYYFHGDRVLNILAKLSFAKFAKEFFFTQKVQALCIDTHCRRNFSHTAILGRHLKSECIMPQYNRLNAQNHVQYASKDLEFRQKNPRKFHLKDITNEHIILIDDIVTTGTTLLEAKKVCEKQNNEVLFALTLADAKL